MVARKMIITQGREFLIDFTARVLFNLGVRISQIKEFFSRAEVKQSRSTALRPFHVTIGIVASLIGSIVTATSIWKWDLPNWLLGGLLGIFVLVVVVFLGVYVFFLLKDPDALCSWVATFRGTEITRGAIGDDIQGEISEDRENLKKLPDAE